jgi:membrane protein
VVEATERRSEWFNRHFSCVGGAHRNPNSAHGPRRFTSGTSDDVFEQRSEPGQAPLSPPHGAAKCFLSSGWSGTLAYQGMLRPLQQLRRATLQALSHDVLTLARATAYSAILGLFPALLVVTTLLALVPQSDTLMGEIRTALADFLPGNAVDAIQDYFNAKHVRSLQALSSALLVTLFGCMGLMSSFMQGFRRAFASPIFDESRTQWNPRRERLTALVLIPSCLVPMALSTVLVAFGHQLEQWVIDVAAHSFEPYVLFLWRMSRWSIAILCTAVVLAVIYRFGTPRRQSWRDVLPGAVMSAVIWFVTTLVFGWYVTRFADYTIIYGSLGTAVATLVWLYITALAVFLGAEYNAQVEADHIAQAESVPANEQELILP